MLGHICLGNRLTNRGTAPMIIKIHAFVGRTAQATIMRKAAVAPTVLNKTARQRTWPNQENVLHKFVAISTVEISRLPVVRSKIAMSRPIKRKPPSKPKIPETSEVIATTARAAPTKPISVICVIRRAWAPKPRESCVQHLGSTDCGTASVARAIPANRLSQVRTQPDDCHVKLRRTGLGARWRLGGQR